MTICTFQPGDEAAQVAIYNAAAAGLPRFKPATLPEVQRRTRARGFDPATRFYAEEGGRTVAYAVFNANGRVSYPWCCPGHEALAEPLFAHVLDAMRRRGMPRAFAAYRADWQPVTGFFEAHGFGRARDVVNFVVDLTELPTTPARRASAITGLETGDVPAVLELAPEALRVRTAAELERHLFHNPYFTPEALFALRSRAGDGLVGVGVLVLDVNYADPTLVDSAMPCFRLGAFGSEGMDAKRIKGLFSFLARDDANLQAVGLDLLGHAALRLDETDDLGTLAAQTATDVPYLLRFYEKLFRRQGSFPVYERPLDQPPGAAGP